MSIDPRAYSEERLTPPEPLPYVSRRALKRVKHPMRAPEHCPLCGCNVTLIRNDAIYGQIYGGWPFAYRCDDESADCGAFVGLHPDTDIPLGTLADRDLRAARSSAKGAWQRLSANEGWSRSKAYRWLASALEIDADTCHFGWFDLDLCQTAEMACLAHHFKRTEQ
jgi:hypothetical protein